MTENICKILFCLANKKLKTKMYNGGERDPTVSMAYSSTMHPKGPQLDGQQWSHDPRVSPVQNQK